MYELIYFKYFIQFTFEISCQAKNFKVADRRNCLDLNHAVLVLQSLGRFHAISHVLLQRGILNKDDLGIHYMQSNSSITMRLLEGAYRQLACVMDEHWPPKWLVCYFFFPYFSVC